MDKFGVTKETLQRSHVVFVGSHPRHLFSLLGVDFYSCGRVSFAHHRSGRPRPDRVNNRLGVLWEVRVFSVVVVAWDSYKLA